MRRLHPTSKIMARWALLFSMLLLPTLFVGCGGDDSKSDGPGAVDPPNGGDENDGDGENGGDSGSSGDIGANDPNLLVAIGDSITAGSTLAGPSYPERLAGILGKNVKNRGVPGARSAAAGGQAGGALALKPAYLLIMFGTNDVFDEINADAVTENIAVAVRKARAQKTIPVVATIPPNLKSDFQEEFVVAYNNRIRSMAKREGARLANVGAEFGSGAGLIQEDGYHPNETGAQVIAYTFADAIR